MAKRMTREESRADTRRRLLDAAAEVFASDGYHAASVDDVAEQAGFSKGALYYNFKSKDDLLLALVEERSAQMMERLREVMDEQATLDGKLLALAAAMVSHVPDHGQLLLELEFWPHAVRDPELRRRVAAAQELARAAIADLIASQAEQAGIEVQLPPAELATAVMALGAGLAVQEALSPRSVRPGLFPAVVGLLLGGSVPRELQSDSPPAGRRRARG